MPVKQTPVQFDHAETVEKLAKDLVKQHHPELVNCNIAYLFKNKTIVKSGKTVIATAERCNAKTQTLCQLAGGDEFHFVISMCYEAWNNLTDKQRCAILDHELSHCFITEDEKTGEPLYKILPHDLEEFTAVVKRHGLYAADLNLMKQAMDDAEEEDE